MFCCLGVLQVARGLQVSQFKCDSHVHPPIPHPLLCSQNDRGFQDGQSVVFHSYVKARIACLEVSNYKDVTKPGAVDYYYNVVSECGCG